MFAVNAWVDCTGRIQVVQGACTQLVCTVHALKGLFLQRHSNELQSTQTSTNHRVHVQYMMYSAHCMLLMQFAGRLLLGPTLTSVVGAPANVDLVVALPAATIVLIAQ